MIYQSDLDAVANGISHWTDIDNAKHENMMAWKETTLEYGKY